MQFEAILAKELISRLRGWRSAVIITLYLVFLASLGIGFFSRRLAALGSHSILDRSVLTPLGTDTFNLLAGFQLLLVIFITPALTAGAISGEKERQTFDLLLCTKLSSFSIVIGKFLASLSFILLLIASSLPLFSLAFLFGGVGLDQVLSVFLIYLVNVLMLGAAGIFVSTMVRRVQVSYALAYAIALFSTFGISVIAQFYTRPFIFLSPIIALISTLPSSTGVIPSIPFLPIALPPIGDDPDYALLLPSVWEYNVLINLFLTLLLLLWSVVLLRPRRY